MQHHEKLTQTLFRIANAVNTTENLNDLFKSIHGSLNSVIEASNFYIAMYDKPTDTISFPYNVDLADGVLDDIISASTSSSLTSKVIQTGKPLFFKKEEAIALANRMNLATVGTPAELWLGVPLKTKGDIIGAIVVQDYHDPDIYHQKDMDLLIAVSDQVALAIERKRAEDAEIKSKAINKVLFSISNAVNTTTNLFDLYKSIHKSLGNIIDLTNFLLGIRNRTNNTVNFEYFVDQFDDFLGNSVKMDKEFLGKDIILYGKSLFLKEKDLNKRIVTNQVVGTWPKTWMGVPLIVEDEVIGYMATQSYDRPDIFTREDLEILSSVSAQVALAIDRKRSIEDLKQSEKLTKVLYKISNAVNITENLDELYRSIHNTLSQVKPLPNFTICILYEKEGVVRWPLFIDEFDGSSTIRELPYDKNSPTIAVKVLKSGKPLFLNQAQLIKRAQENKILGHLPVIWLGVPLIIRGKVIGVMVVQHYSDPHYFVPADLDLFVSISDQIALAIERKQSQNNILKHKKNLEQTVKERTKELRQSCADFEMSEKRFREMAELLPQAVFELDIEGRVTYTNKHGFKLTGYSIIEFKQGLSVFQLLDERDHEQINQGMAQMCSERTSRQVEYMLKKKDGSYIPILLYINVILTGDKPVGFRGVMVDMTESKRTEELMIQTEKMMSVGGLAAGMAHEINNPLAGIIQNAQVLHNRLTMPMPANENVLNELGVSMDVIKGFMEKRGILTYLDNISIAGKQAAKIIDNMLGFARKSDFIKQTHRLDEILETSLELARNDYDLKKQYDFKRINIIKNYDPKLPGVLCERIKIQQVIFNILKNASQAMYTMEKRNKEPQILLCLSLDENMARIEIKDNGPGMDRATRKKVFEPFFTTKELGKGTGLGLSVSYFIIVDDHGGEMELQSAPGKGSSFIIRLPLA